MEYKVDVESVKKYIETNDISQRELARRMKIDSSTVIKVLSGERNPGMKFVEGLFNLGFSVNKTFTRKSFKSKENENTVQSICNYMNTMGSYHKKEYTIYEVYNIKSAIELEKVDRIANNIKVNGNTIEGRKKLNERIAKICNVSSNTKITLQDVKLYKKCVQLEYKDRNLINSMENEDD